MENRPLITKPLWIALNAVAHCHGCSPDDILRHRGNKDVMQARQMFCYVCNKTLGLSLKQIARFINRDHTTVLAARDALERKRNEFYTDWVIKNIRERVISELTEYNHD